MRLASNQEKHMDIKQVPSRGDYESGGEYIDLGPDYYVKVQIEQDQNHGKPWEESDGHIVGIREAKTNYTRHVSKSPGERILLKGGRNGYTYVYDFNASIKTALKDGWGISDVDTTGWSKRRIAATAVERNAEYHRQWLNNEWYWIGVIVTVFRRNKGGMSPDEPYDKQRDDQILDESLWGIESFGDYWKEVVVELVGSSVEDDMKDRRQSWRQALAEAREVKYWAARDVVTCGLLRTHRG